MQYTLPLEQDARLPSGCVVHELSVTYRPSYISLVHILSRPEHVVAFVRPALAALDREDQEGFWVIPLTRKNSPKGIYLMTLGTATSTLAHPREVLRIAIACAATGFICIHNHPSGDPAPSGADVQVTRQIREASRIVDIEMLDHVILGTTAADPQGRGYYSFREAGFL